MTYGPTRSSPRRPRGPNRISPPRPDPANLRRLNVTEGFSIAVIAKRLAVSSGVIRAALDADGITVSRPGWTASTPPPISEKQPRDLYVDQQMSTRQVADVLKCTPARVLAALKRHGFTIDSRWPVIPPLPADAPTMFDLYVTQRLDDATIAQQYDVPTWRVTKNRRELGCAPATRAHAAAIDPAAPAPVELQRLYVDDGRTLEQIAREKHTSTTVVRRWLEVAQIPIQPRTSREHRKQLDPVLVAELYQERGMGSRRNRRITGRRSPARPAHPARSRRPSPPRRVTATHPQPRHHRPAADRAVCRSGDHHDAASAPHPAP